MSMKLKGLLFGSAFAIIPSLAFAGGGDLGAPEEQAVAPVNFVKLCDTYGEKFQYIGGSDTCLKIGGAVRVQSIYSNHGSEVAEKNAIAKPSNDIVFHRRFYLDFDARTDTESGLLRSFVLIQGDIATPSERKAVDLFDDKGKAKEKIDPVKSEGGKPNLSITAMFIEFNGITAGYTGSFFNMPAGYDYSGGYASDVTTNLVGYTYEMDNGLSFSASLEDTTGRRAGLSPLGGDEIAKIGYKSALFPDGVAKVGFSNDTLDLTASAAVHPVNYGYTVKPADKLSKKRAFGYAFAAGGVLKLNDGNTLASLTGAYASGASSYLGFGSQDHHTIEIGDGVVDANGKFKAHTGWSTVGSLQHTLNEQIKLALTASYGDVKLAKGSKFKKVSSMRVSGNLSYYPVKNLEIGLGVGYDRINAKALTKADNKKFDFFTGILRMQRRF